jgi:PKD repeat protein
MAYKRIATSSGRLLNTQSEASKDWLMGLYNGHDQTFYPNFAVNLPSSGADLFWHLDWATWNTSTGLGQLYSATSSSPSSVAFSATNAGGGGFDQLRLFSRSSGSEVQTADIGFIKVYNGVLDLATVQSLYATYKARFGY